MAEREHAPSEWFFYVNLIWRKKWICILCGIFGLVSATVFDYLAPRSYSASAQVLLQPISSSELISNSGIPQELQPGDIATDIELFNTEQVTAIVRKQLHSVPKINVQELGNTNILSVNANSSSASKAAIIANAYANAFVAVMQSNIEGALTNAENSVSQKIVSVQNQINSINLQIQNSKTNNPQVISSYEIEIQNLESQLATLENEQTNLQVLANSGLKVAQLVLSAAPPSAPSSPKPYRDIPSATLIALLIGVFIIVIIEKTDTSIKGIRELEHISAPVPLLGIIPEVETWKSRKEPVLISLSNSNTPVAEGFRNLRTSIEFMKEYKDFKSILISSSVTGEGKSTLTANLGIALAEAGFNVSILSADLRRPNLHKYFSLNNSLGLSSVLAGNASLDEVIYNVKTTTGHLSIVPSGVSPANPSELLSYSNLSDIIDTLSARSDILLVDAPPILPISDALVIMRYVEAVVLVAYSGVTKKGELSRTIKILKQFESNVIGAVLNGHSYERDSEYAYGYDYGYYNTSPRHVKKTGRAEYN
jgi:capsular exopolysaccharide synthesis family protein